MCQEHLGSMLKSTMKYSAHAIQNAHKIKWENVVNCYITEKVSIIILHFDAYSKSFPIVLVNIT